MRKSVLVALFLLLSFITFLPSKPSDQDSPTYIRYFLSEQDYNQNLIQEKPEDGIPYLKVIYNEKSNPISLLRIDVKGKIWEKNVFSYNPDGTLESKFVFGASNNPQYFYVYGVREPWAKAFRDYTFTENLNQSFMGQTSKFHFSEDGTLKSIEFKSVDSQPYGRINFVYDHLGLVREEIWRSLPSAKLIRRYVYNIDLQKQSKKLWEYGIDGEEVSYVELEMAPEDKLYPNPLPRTGNTLDEIDIVLREIIQTGIMPPFPANIPHMESDQILLQNGDLMDVEIIQVTSVEVTFKLNKDEAHYTMPLSRIREVKNQWGEILYPRIK